MDPVPIDLHFPFAGLDVSQVRQLRDACNAFLVERGEKI